MVMILHDLQQHSFFIAKLLLLILYLRLLLLLNPLNLNRLRRLLSWLLLLLSDEICRHRDLFHFNFWLR